MAARFDLLPRPRVRWDLADAGGQSRRLLRAGGAGHGEGRDEGGRGGGEWGGREAVHGMVSLVEAVM